MGVSKYYAIILILIYLIHFIHFGVLRADVSQARLNMTLEYILVN